MKLFPLPVILLSLSLPGLAQAANPYCRGPTQESCTMDPNAGCYWLPGRCVGINPKNPYCKGPTQEACAFNARECYWLGGQCKSTW